MRFDSLSFSLGFVPWLHRGISSRFFSFLNFQRIPIEETAKYDETPPEETEIKL
jgi:hypothetical protein